MDANVYASVTLIEARTSVSRSHVHLEFESATATILTPSNFGISFVVAFIHKDLTTLCLQL